MVALSQSLLLLAFVGSVLAFVAAKIHDANER